MTITLRTAATAAALALALGHASSALAKAHDQGVADGDATPQPTTGAFIQSLGGNGVSALTSGGARGDAASTNQGGNRVTPTVGNGVNAD